MIYKKHVKNVNEIIAKKNIFSKPKIQKFSKFIQTLRIEIWESINLIFSFLNLGSQNETKEEKFKFVIIGCDLLNLCLKLKMIKILKFWRNFLKKKTFGWRKIGQKIETFLLPKLQSYWHVMDLKMWCYFYKKHLAVLFRNYDSRKNIF